jgi:RNA polymerase sigma-70 factor (ECF subfamily)
MTKFDASRRTFGTVVQANLDDAYALAMRLCRNGADAEDIVQEAAMRALRALETEDVAHPKAWFLTIVRNCAYTFLERSRASPVAAVGDVHDLADQGEIGAWASRDDAEVAIIAAQDGEQVRKAIDALPIAMREALVMREINELSYKEIAQAQGVPMGTVMSRLARARDLLADMLRGLR